MSFRNVLSFIQQLRILELKKSSSIFEAKKYLRIDSRATEVKAPYTSTPTPVVVPFLLERLMEACRSCGLVEKVNTI